MSATSTFAPSKSASPQSTSTPNPTPPSPRRIAANRQNAQHSTGPKTPQGKQRSSKNASTHRIYSPFLLHQGDDESFFISFRDSLLKDLFPQNNLELAQADRVIALHWKLRRIQFAENELNSIQNQQFQDQLKTQSEIIENKRERHIANCEQVGIDCTEEDLAELGLAELDPNAPPIIPQSGYFLAQSLRTSQTQGTRFTPEERLLNIETKLHSLLTKAMKEYRQLQSERQKQEQAQSEEEDDGREPFCRYLTPTPNPDDDDETEKAQDNNDTDTNGDAPEESATPNHPAQQGATFPPVPHQNEATCQNGSSPSTPSNSAESRTAI